MGNQPLESEDLSRILDQINEGIVSTDSSGRVRTMNREALRLLGLSTCEAEGREIAEILPLRTDDGASGADVLAAAIRANRAAAPDNNFHLHDRTVSVAVVPLPSGAAVILHDINRQHEQNQQLADIGQRLLNFFNSSPMGIHSYELGPDDRLTFIRSNPAADCILKVDHSKFVGQAIEQAFPGLIGTGIPDRYREVARNGSVWRSEQVYYEDGGGIRGAFEVIAFQPSPSRVAVMFLDINERRRNDDERRKLALLVEHSSELVNLATPDGRMIFLNPGGARIFGIEPAEVGNYNIFDVIPDDLQQQVKQEILPQIMSTGVWEGELRYRNIRDGREVEAHTLAMAVRSPETGEVSFLANLSRDISELKRLEREQRTLEAKVQHAQKLESLGVLAGGMAHDFNNILMTVMGNADLAQADLSPDSAAYERMEDIKQAAARAANLCRQLLAYSGKGRFLVEILDLQKVVTGMTAMLEVSVSHRAALRCTFGKEVPPVRADQSQLRQVILNLITNASEAIREGNGVINVTTGVMRCDRAYLQSTYYVDDLPEGMYSFLEVSDTGMGMDRQTVTRIFDPFFTTKFTGRGLGLSAVLGIIRGHKGTVKVYSEPGRGTIVKVLLPAVLDGRPALAEPSRSTGECVGGGTVLLVDDEPMVRKVASAMLRHFGFGVIECCSGREAVETYRERAEEIQVVLLDLTMPDMDGEATFRELRRIRSEVRVIMTSGYNEQEIVQRFVGRGLAGFIQKPYPASALLEKIREVLN